MPSFVTFTTGLSCTLISAVVSIGCAAPSIATIASQADLYAYNQFRINALDLYFSGMWKDEDLNAIRPIAETDEPDADEEPLEHIGETDVDPLRGIDD